MDGVDAQRDQGLKPLAFRVNNGAVETAPHKATQSVQHDSCGTGLDQINLNF
jgi:hypothetical protein